MSALERCECCCFTSHNATECVSSRITLKPIGALRHGCAGRATRAMSPDHDGSLPRNRYLDMYEYAIHFFRLLLLGIGGVRCLVQYLVLGAETQSSHQVKMPSLLIRVRAAHMKKTHINKNLHLRKGECRPREGPVACSVPW